MYLQNIMERPKSGERIMGNFLQDLRHSSRLLWNKRGYSMLVILTLALGIGAVTSVFSVVSAVLIKPYGPVNTDQWVYVWEHRKNAEALNQISVSVPNFRDWKQDGASVFSDAVVWLPWRYTASGAGVSDPERIRAAVISPEVFTAAGVMPAAGRLLTADDSASGDRRVVLSYEFWRRAYGADASLPGKTITLNSATHTVVGIAPPGFSFPPEDQVDVWTAIPQAVLSSPDRSQRGYRVAAKLRPGVTAEAAQSTMNVIADRLASLYPEDKEYGAQVIPMREGVAGDFRAPILALSGALGFALLLLCINISYLRRVHLEARRKEIALRVALGAGRMVLIRELLMETMLLFGIGGAVGILISPVGVRLLLSFVPPQEIPWLHARIDGFVLLGSISLTLLAAVLTGLVPVLQVSRSDLARNLGSGGAVTGVAGVSCRLRGAMIVPQVALALVPLCGAGLLMRSFVRLQEVKPGFSPEHRLTLSLFAPKGHYSGPAEISNLATRLRQGALQVPGVREAGLGQAIPFGPGARWLQALTPTDPKGIHNISQLPLVRYTVVTPGYLEAVGIPLKAGRLVSDADTRETLPVVVISEKLAHQQFAQEDPLGKQIWIGHAEALPNSSPRTIVGVVGDTRMYALDREPDPAAWVPMGQESANPDIWRNLFLVVNTGINPASVLTGIGQKIHGIDAELAIADVSSMDELLSESLWRQRFSANVLGAFSLSALGIAMLGVFGVTSYLVALRSHEIGVRMAIGARPGDILKMVLEEIFVLVAIGAAVGLSGAFALTRVLQGLLFGVNPTDSSTFEMVAGVLAICSMVACLVPARRAAKVDPLVVLRAE
jgi:putative ABC transport system permease protein